MSTNKEIVVVVNNSSLFSGSVYRSCWLLPDERCFFFHYYNYFIARVEEFLNKVTYLVQYARQYANQ